MLNTQKADFPRMVYKRGTGRAVDEYGGYQADGHVVHTKEELAELGGDYVETPAEAASGASAQPKREVTPAEVGEEHASRHHRKAK